MVRGAFHDREGGQRVGVVEAHVQLRGGLLPAVAGPVEAVESERERGGINGVDVLFHAREIALVAVCDGEVGEVGGEVGVGFPEERLGHGGVARAVGVGESVAVRRSGAPDARPLRTERRRRVNDGIEAGVPRELPEEQRHDMACGAEFARVDLVLLGQFRDEARRDLLDNLR